MLFLLNDVIFCLILDMAGIFQSFFGGYIMIHPHFMVEDHRPRLDLNTSVGGFHRDAFVGTAVQSAT